MKKAASRILPALLLASLAAACSGQEGENGDAVPDTAADAPRSERTETRPDSPAATPDTSDTAAVPDTPAARPDTSGAAADTAPDPREAEGEPYFVRLRAGAEPESVAAKHGVTPLDVIRSPVPAFYAALSSEQVRSLRRDSLVESLAREIHQGDPPDEPPPLRGVPPQAGDSTR